MSKKIIAIISLSIPLLCVSCVESKADALPPTTRIPQPPSGSSTRLIPQNKIQKFEGDAALGPLANPRR